MKYRKAPTQFHHVLHYMTLAILFLSVRVTGGTIFPNRLDIAFAVDTASSQSLVSFNQLKSEVKSIVSGFPVGQDMVRLALISMSRVTNLMVNFDRVNSISDFNTAVDILKFSPGVADISCGMKLAKDSVLSTARNDASKILILVKDRRSLFGDVSSASAPCRMTTKTEEMKAPRCAINVVGIGGLWNRLDLGTVFGNSYILFGCMNDALAYIKSLNNTRCTPEVSKSTPEVSKNTPEITKSTPVPEIDEAARCTAVKSHPRFGLCYKSMKHFMKVSVGSEKLPNGTVKCEKKITRKFVRCTKKESCMKSDRKVGACIDGRVKIESIWHMFSYKNQSCISYKETASVKCEDAHKCNSQVADVYFLLDKSDSIGGNFPQVKQATKTIIESLAIGPNNVRVGVLRFATLPNVTVDIELGSINNKTALLSAIDRIPNVVRGATLTNEALKTARKAFASKLGRKSVNKFIFVITDGESTLPNETFSETVALKNAGVTIYAVGVGYVKISELETMTAPESSTNMFILNMFTELQQWARNFSKNSCIRFSAPNPKLCENNAYIRSISTCTAGKKLVTETKYKYDAVRKCIKTIHSSIVEDCNITPCVDPIDGNEYLEGQSWENVCHKFRCSRDGLIAETTRCLAADGSCKRPRSPAFKCRDERGVIKNNCRCVQKGTGGVALAFET